METLQELWCSTIRASHRSSYAFLSLDDGENISFADFFTRVNFLVSQLSAISKSPARIALAFPKSLDNIVALVATIIAGHVAIPLNPSAPSDYYSNALKRCEATVLILGTLPTAQQQRILKENETIQCFYLKGGAFHLVDRSSTDCNNQLISSVGASASWEFSPSSATVPSSPCMLLFSSGTTGASRIVQLSQENIITNIRNAVHFNGLTAEDKTILLNPLFHTGGITACLASLFSSGSTVLLASADPEEIGNAIRTEGITWLWTSPTTIILLDERLRKGPMAALPTLKHIRVGSAPLDETVRERVEKNLNVPILISFGTTENGAFLCGTAPSKNFPCCIGQPAVWSKFFIVDENNRILPANEIGELVTAGPGNCIGYLDSPADECILSTADGPIKGIRTGDLAVVDLEGLFYLKGRKKELINRGGEKINPAEIDEKLAHHKMIKQAVTFACSEATFGEEVYCAVLLHGDEELLALLDNNKLEESFNSLLSPHYSSSLWPKHYFIVSSFPLTSTGKISRRLLGEKFLQEIPRTTKENSIDSIREQVCRILRIELKPENLNESLSSLGLNSSSAIQIMQKINEFSPSNVSFNFQRLSSMKLSELFDLPRKSLENPSNDSSHRSPLKIIESIKSLLNLSEESTGIVNTNPLKPLKEFSLNEEKYRKIIEFLPKDFYEENEEILCSLDLLGNLSLKDIENRLLLNDQVFHSVEEYPISGRPQEIERKLKKGLGKLSLGAKLQYFDWLNENQRKQRGKEGEILHSNLVRLSDLSIIQSIQQNSKPFYSSVIFVFSPTGPPEDSLLLARMFAHFKVFRSTIIELNGIYREISGIDLMVDHGFCTSGMKPERLVQDVRLSIPCLFILQYAVVKTLGSLGVHPDLVFGHSMGEFSAFVFAHRLPIRSALEILLIRCDQATRVPFGDIIIFDRKYLTSFSALEGPKDLYIIATLTDALVTVGGSLESIDELERHAVASSEQRPFIFRFPKGFSNNRQFHRAANECSSTSQKFFDSPIFQGIQRWAVENSRNEKTPKPAFVSFIDGKEKSLDDDSLKDALWRNMFHPVDFYSQCQTVGHFIEKSSKPSERVLLIDISSAAGLVGILKQNFQSYPNVEIGWINENHIIEYAIKQENPMNSIDWRHHILHENDWLEERFFKEYNEREKK